MDLIDPATRQPDSPPAPLGGALGGIPATTERALLRQKSRDFYWYSPVLKKQLDGKVADLVVTPRTEDEVVHTLRACRAQGVPVTARGGGTGNYGQCVPLQGGVVLDLASMTELYSLRDGIAEVAAGARLIDIDRWARPRGWELRVWPSTKRTATIGGFISGGGAGVGGLMHGTMREPGNLLGVRLATMEDTPRLMDLPGHATGVVNRTYGTTGILTRLHIALAPAQDWRDLAVVFERFDDAVAFAWAAGSMDAIARKMLAVFDPSLPPFFRGLAPSVPAGASLVLAMVAPNGRDTFVAQAERAGGRLVAEQSTVAAEADGDATPFYEYCWNHTTLQVLKRDRAFTYLQCRYPAERIAETVDFVRSRFPDEVWQHMEVTRFAGVLALSGLPVLRWTNEERLNETMAAFEAEGIGIANPHVYTVEDGSAWKRADGDQLGFKHRVDPLGLLNPGKMRTFTPASTPAPKMA